MKEDIRTLLNGGIRVSYLIEKGYKLGEIKDEVREMIGDDLADVALRVAIDMADEALINNAARVVLCGEYGENAKKLAAARYLGFDPFVQEIARRLNKNK